MLIDSTGLKVYGAGQWLVETAMGLYKGIIGARLRSRNWAAQQCEVAIGVAVLNRMTEARLSADYRTNVALPSEKF